MAVGQLKHLLDDRTEERTATTARRPLPRAPSRIAVKGGGAHREYCRCQDAITRVPLSDANSERLL